MRNWNQFQTGLNRRTFLNNTGVGLGAAALGSLLNGEQLAAAKKTTAMGGLPGLPHIAPEAKRVIFLDGRRPHASGNVRL
mgnify:CR=1 FL=1